jgi:NADH-quinone oxidoreductase subunit L
MRASCGGERLIDLVWLVPLLPFGASVVNLLVGRRLGRPSGWLATVAVAGSFVLAAGILVDMLSHPASDRVFILHLIDWISVGAFRVAFDLRVDQLSATMMLVVTGIGAMIHLSAIGYMAGEERYARFFAYMNLFVAFMLILVLADNYLLLYLGWEGVGLCSYLLIGFDFERRAAANAAKKAFITTRIGDTLMLVGIALIFIHFHSLGFGRVLGAGPARAGVSTGSATVIALLLLAGAVGKSAQVPLHVWLPDAMEGPSPVSALIHAATMVTAGVYLVVRSHVLFEYSGVALAVVLVVGLVTVLYGGLSALGQDDLKRVLAYSTISQLGYMFLAAGMRAYGAAMLLLVAHAFYKALLFLGAGNVMHGLDGELDMRRMGGLRSDMPVTAALFCVGAAALAGLPPLAGFFAKDAVVNYASETGRIPVYVLALGGAVLSALYAGRALFLTFFGERRAGLHAHEAPPIMLWPLVVLALGGVTAGLLGLSADNGVLQRWLQPVIGALQPGERGPAEVVLVVLATAVALLGAASAWYIWGSGRVDWMRLRERLGVQPALAAGLGVDALYARTNEVAGEGSARFLAYTVDRRWIDGVVNALRSATRGLSGVARRVQTGLVRTYALALLLGAVGLLLYLGWRF